MWFLNTLKEKARQLKSMVMVVYHAYRDPRTPWFAKIFAGLVVAYAFSPIDLVPDFIPILGLLDDLLLIPLGVALCMKMIPEEVLESARLKAEEVQTRPTNIWAAIFIVLFWVIILALILKFIFFN
ncbi:MAG: DUF1232 domain-containing protein [Caldisericia bacterium]|nr:DUF1232 domain-containing protein [Caldisericia bacterium]